MTPNENEVAYVGDGVYVGNYLSCDSHSKNFEKIIHISRNRDGSHTCKDKSNGLAIKWREEEGLDQLSIPLGDILEYSKGYENLLVHCRLGVCRSTLIALACKINRGRDPWYAIQDVNRSQWRYRRQVAAWNTNTLIELLDCLGVE